MGDWNYANVFEAVAASAPDAPAQIQGDRVVAWGDFDRRANALAADLLTAGLGHQAKVAAYLHNGPHYLEAYAAAFKAGLAPVNTNYRYGPGEVRYLFDNADAEAVVFHASFTPVLEEVRAGLPGVRRWYAVEDGAAVPDWAVPYEEVVARGADRVEAPWGRSGDDLLLMYTGGTTGMPKGVMWRQDDLFMVLGGGGNVLLGVPPAESLEQFASRLPDVPKPVVLVACPLMHGTGQFSAFVGMALGGAVVSLPSRHFDPHELWTEVERCGVTSIIIVGDAFARPMLRALDEAPDRYDLSSVASMTSSGVMWSQEVKDGLLRHLPQAALFDSYGSSEGVGLGGSLSTKGQAATTARFTIGERVKVLREDGTPVEPGSPESGMVAITGYIPVGYYKDEAKTAATFRTYDGVRYSIPGDWAQVAEDGTLLLLGRGSVCINTGGEKVFPEEVEEALKTHPAVHDAVCVGVPDERFGEAITAVVEPEPSVDGLDADALIAHVKGQLAHYKAPRHVVAVDTIGRAPNGKVDYRRLKALARERVGA